MMSGLRVTQPGLSRLSVLIDDIDIPNRIVHVYDRSGGFFQATFHDVDDTLPIPAPGEQWIAERMSWDSWRLSGRVSQQGYTDILSNLNPGDRLIAALGDIWLHGDRVLVDNDPVDDLEIVNKGWVEDYVNILSGAHTIDSHLDIDVTGVATGHALFWDGGLNKWVNYPAYTKSQVDALLTSYATITYVDAEIAAISSGGPWNVTSTKVANYSIALGTDDMVPIDSSGGSFSLELPASPAVGEKVYVKDVGGACETYPVTVTTAGSETIEGFPTFLINEDRVSFIFWSDGVNYHIT